MFVLILKENNIYKWVKVFKNGPRKICGRQPLKNVKGYGLLQAVPLQNFKRLYSANFTWSILEYLDPNDLMNIIDLGLH